MLIRKRFQAQQICLVIWWLVILLGLPKRLCQTVHHQVFQIMYIQVLFNQCVVSVLYANRLVSLNLFTQGYMHPHMQKRVGLAGLG